MRVRFLVTLLVVGCAAQSSANEQQASSGSADARAPVAATVTSDPERRWSLTVDFGVASSGPARDIEEAMRAAHFGDTMDGWAGEQYIHPYSRTGFAAIWDAVPVLVEAQYQIRGPWSVGVLFSHMPIGGTHGYHDPHQLASIEYKVTSVAAMVSAGPPAFQIGLGPALHTAQERGELRSSQMGPWRNHSTLGFIAQARARSPARWRVFLDLTAGYRFVGRAAVGPYATSAGRWDTVTTFPSTNVRYNHWFIGAGPGLRF
jgi:hypothetical protein